MISSSNKSRNTEKLLKHSLKERVSQLDIGPFSENSWMIAVWSLLFCLFQYSFLERLLGGPKLIVDLPLIWVCLLLIRFSPGQSIIGVGIVAIVLEGIHPVPLGTYFVPMVLALILLESVKPFISWSSPLSWGRTTAMVSGFMYAFERVVFWHYSPAKFELMQSRVWIALLNSSLKIIIGSLLVYGISKYLLRHKLVMSKSPTGFELRL